MGEKLTIYLTSKEWQALNEAALESMRNIRSQARFLITRGLGSRLHSPDPIIYQGDMQSPAPIEVEACIHE